MSFQNFNFTPNKNNSFSKEEKNKEEDNSITYSNNIENDFSYNITSKNYHDHDHQYMQSDIFYENNEEYSYNKDPLEIKTTLINPQSKIGIESNLQDNVEYNKAESNFILTIDPKIIIFNGFIANDINNIDNSSQKIYIQKANVINISKFSQRITILPPTSPFFKIKYTKRGLIPSGLSEVIQILFTPNKYQYYYDFIKIYCEGAEKLTIPIHAYPLMNIHQSPNYIPKTIDFNNIVINKKVTKVILLENIIPTASFEFEFVPIKTCQEVEITPTHGEIRPNSQKEIVFSFCSSRFGVFIGEYEFRLSEFNFKGIKITISGCCNIASENCFSPEKYKKILEKSINPFKEAVNKIIYPVFKSNKENHKDNRKENNINKELKRLNINEVKEDPNVDIESKETLKEISNKLSSRKLALSSRKIVSLAETNDYIMKKEKEFLEYYNSSEIKIKEKEIKYIQFIGKKQIEDYEISYIKSERQKEKDLYMLFNKGLDLQRRENEYDTIKPNINQSNEEIIIKPTFKLNSNNKFFKTKQYFQIFLKGVTKIVINNRAEKVLTKLKTMIKSNNIKTPQDFSDFVEKDWEMYNNKEDDEEEYVRPKINKFNIQENRNDMLIGEEFNIDMLKQEIPHENLFTFENYKYYDEFEKYDNDYMNYKEFKTNGYSLYEINTDDLSYRVGACNEKISNPELGDVFLSKNRIYNLIDSKDSLDKYTMIGAYDSEDVVLSNPYLRQLNNPSCINEQSFDYTLFPKGVNLQSYSLSSSEYQYNFMDNLNLNEEYVRKDLNRSGKFKFYICIFYI